MIDRLSWLMLFKPSALLAVGLSFSSVFLSATSVARCQGLQGVEGLAH